MIYLHQIAKNRFVALQADTPAARPVTSSKVWSVLPPHRPWRRSEGGYYLFTRGEALHLLTGQASRRHSAMS